MSWVCVRRSVGPSVRRSIGPSVRSTLYLRNPLMNFLQTLGIDNMGHLPRFWIESFLTYLLRVGLADFIMCIFLGASRPLITVVIDRSPREMPSWKVVLYNVSLICGSPIFCMYLECIFMYVSAMVLASIVRYFISSVEYCRSSVYQTPGAARWAHHELPVNCKVRYIIVSSTPCYV